MNAANTSPPQPPPSATTHLPEGLRAGANAESASASPDDNPALLSRVTRQMRSIGELVIGIVVSLGVAVLVVLKALFPLFKLIQWYYQGVLGVIGGLLLLAGIIALIVFAIKKAREALIVPSAVPAQPNTDVPSSSPSSVNAESRADHDSTRWWLHFAGESTGPFTQQAILAAVTAGDFSPDQLVCPVGGEQWQPISAWPASTGKTPKNESTVPAQTDSLAVN